MPTQVVPLEGIAKIGVIKDSPAVTLPPGAWTDARNVRFDDGAIRRMKGEVEIFATHGLTDIQHIVYWENPNVRCYVVINREDDGDHAYLVGLDGEGNGITSDKGTFTMSNNWTSTQFNGGYSIIINNGIDAPHHFTVQLGGSARITNLINSGSTGNFEPLPNWDSYASGSYVANFLSVSADVLVAYGNLLIAGALTERSLPQLPAVSAGSVTAGALTLTFSDPNYTPTVNVGDEIQIVGDPDYIWTYTAVGDGTLLIPNVDDRVVTESSPYVVSPYAVTAVGINSITLTPNTAFPFPEESSDGLVLDNVTRTFDANGVETTDPPSIDALPPFSASGDITIYHTANADMSIPRTEIVRDLNGVVRTSSVAAPGQIPQNWNPFDTAAGTADEINLADTGKIVAIRELRGNPFVYTSDTITQLRVSAQGLTQVPITKEFGALTQGGVFEFKGAHLVVGSDDIYIFAGNPGDIKSIADGRVRNYFYDNLDPLTFRDMQVVRNQINDEVWICYPKSTDGLDEALVWNYTDNTWTMRDLPRATSFTTGPIPGMSTDGTFYSPVGDSFTGYRVTIVNANGQTSVMDSDLDTMFFTRADLLTAINFDVNGQAGFASRVINDGLLVNDARLGPTPWQLTIEVEVTSGASLVPVDGDPYDAAVIDNERPWSQNVLNEAKNFIVFTTDRVINACELGYAIDSGASAASVSRDNLHFSPSRETEMLTSVYINMEDGAADTNLRIAIDTKDTAGEDPTSDTSMYMFNAVEDYKTDVRKTSRLINWSITQTAGEMGWTIADISLEVGQGGRR